VGRAARITLRCRRDLPGSRHPGEAVIEQIVVTAKRFTAAAWLISPE
jgi:hypothetical protein